PFGTTSGVALTAPFSLLITQPQPANPATLRIVGGNNQSGSPGSQLPALLVARVEDAAGNPLSGVAVIWQPTGVDLVTRTSTSDKDGIVSATAKLLPTAGPAQVRVSIPNTQVQTGFSLTAVQPQPATLRILDGNNQSGSPGQQLPVPLTARVEDASGNPVPNISVTWQALTPQSVSLGSSAATSDANGIVSATAVLGAPGPAQVLVRVTNAPVQTSFSLQSALTLTGITILSGMDQVTNVGSAFAQPVVVQVFAAEGPAAGIPVQLSSFVPAVVIPNGGLVVT